MSLEPCRECGTSVATGAKTCPQCGAKKPHASPSEVRLDEALKTGYGCGCALMILGVVIPVVVIVFAAIFGLIFG